MNFHLNTAVVVENHYGGILLGLRRNGPGAELWGFPGGKVESVALRREARRELYEETGIVCASWRLSEVCWGLDGLGDVPNLTLYYTLSVGLEQVDHREPEKCERWEWFTPEEINRASFPVMPGVRKAVNLTTERIKS